MHVLFHAGVYDDGPARVVAVFGGVAHGVAHVLQAALIEQVDYQLQLVHALEIGGFGLVARLDERLEGALDQLGDAAAEDRLLAEQVGFGLFLERGFENAGARAADAARIRQAHAVGAAAHVLMHGEKARDARPAREHLSHAVSGRLRGDHRDVHGVRRLDGVEVYVEAVREHERLAGQQMGKHRLAIDLRLHVVGNQHHDDVGLARRVLHQGDFQPVGFGFLPAAAAVVQPDHHVQARILQVERVGVSLAAVADYAYRLVL